MIENLNALSFNKFGRVVHEGFHNACNLINYYILSVRELEITSKTVNKLFRVKGSPVVMDIVDGIALLCISTEPSPDDVKIFLFDKTVCINPGICYSIFPLYGNCVIKYAFKENASVEKYTFSDIITALGFYPKVEINKVHTLFYQEKERGFIFKGEKHDFWELAYVDKGIMYNIVDGAGFRLNQGEVIFYGRSQHHIQWSDIEASICFVTISFDMDFEEASLLTGKKFIVDTEMKELIERIVHEREQNSYYADDLIICYLKEFIIKLVRNEKLENTIHQQDTHIKDKIENSIVAKCTGFIQGNIGSKITISEIARSIPISQSYLSSIFKKHMNMTLVDYINNYRLEKSKDLIRSSECNFTQIADMLGYASVHYFSSQFKLKYGISPTEYARAIRK